MRAGRLGPSPELAPCPAPGSLRAGRRGRHPLGRLKAPREAREVAVQLIPRAGRSRALEREARGCGGRALRFKRGIDG